MHGVTRFAVRDAAYRHANVSLCDDESDLDRHARRTIEGCYRSVSDGHEPGRYRSIGTFIYLTRCFAERSISHRS